MCANLTIGTYSDWFLPSINQLNQMYLNRAAIGGYAAGTHWSSTEFDSTIAWYQYFIDGSQDGTNKDNTYNVRAVRAF
jgi:hypothetical protein